MKIIHTSDWHLGHRLYNYDRTDEESHFFRQLEDVVGRERPDALVICGDIFHTGTPGNDVARVFTERLLSVCAACPGMQTVVIAGNHDSYSRLVIDQALWKRCGVHVFGVPAEDENGLADFGSNVVDIPEKGLIAAVPFCHPRNFPLVAGEKGADREKEYFKGLAAHLQAVSAGRPTVLMAHLAVAADLDLRGHDRSLVVGGEECVSAEELGARYDYVALGHIHCPQWIRDGRKVARYCGTPRPIHFDETYAHGVDVVTIGDGHAVELRTERFEPLHALETIGGDEGVGFDDAVKALSASECPRETYVRLNVRLAAGELPGPDWTEAARAACAAKGLRFCVINPIRTQTADQKEDTKKVLTVAELKELSDDSVLEILSAKHSLTERQRKLIKALMEEVKA